VLLRPLFRPLREVTATVRRIDLLNPGQRVPVAGGVPDVAEFAQAFNDMLERLELERRESARKALIAQESERSRVARELHDEVGQIFTAIMLQIESLATHAPPSMAAELDELRETARTGATDVRKIATRLRPEALEHLGLERALSALATAFSEQTRIPVERDLGARLRLGEERELVVYRVAQEALTNVARHAQARRVVLSLRREDGDAVLCVRDDGRGLPVGAIDSSDGIRGMRERAMLAGGSLTLGRADGGGAQVTLRLPGAA
jgi:two-component system sensor histidine kinase UhpB